MKLRALHTSREWDAYRCGAALAERAKWLHRAREEKWPSLRRVLVGFARDAHREYLTHLKRLTQGAPGKA